MTSQKNIQKFNKIYNSTYNDILKYIICKCHDINDTNDIIQDVYLEFWRILDKKNLEDINYKNYLIGIANNKIKQYYHIFRKLRLVSLFSKDKNDIELIDSVKSGIDIEKIVIHKDNFKEVWDYVKHKKNKDIPKIFYLHYKLDLTIKVVAKELNLKESYVKNLLYRTLNELIIVFNAKGENIDE